MGVTYILGNGSGFGDAIGIKFNGVDAISFDAESDSLIRATFPQTNVNDSLVVNTNSGDINVTDYQVFSDDLLQDSQTFSD